ncbi:MAG: porin [Rhodoblastus sp.]
MKVAKSLLLGTAAVLATVAGAQAADLPTRKAAPVQYVKICDAYGAGFFYIPGTETCLRVGGLVLAEVAVSNTPARLNLANVVLTAGGAGATVGIPGLIPGASRDAVAWAALGRVELDARTQSPWGTVRSFIRIDSYFGSGAVANTGALANAFIGQPALGTQAARESTILNKGFIQFAGFTMGRIQSMFDFYADAATYSGLRGSNQTVNGLAYTATFGGGFSATLAIEDEVSHRARGTVTSSLDPAGVAGTVLPPTVNQFLGTRMPDVVANLRVDQPWGSAQLSGALHRVGVGSVQRRCASSAFRAMAVLNKSDSLGFAVQGGVKFNLDMIAPGDNLWLQATYAKGAVGYTNGSNLAFVNGVYSSTNYGVGIARVSSGNGWQEGVTDGDCVWTYGGTCDKSSAFAVVGAFTHYWTPSVKSWLAAAYYQVNYSGNSSEPAAAGPGARHQHVQLWPDELQGVRSGRRSRVEPDPRLRNRRGSHLDARRRQPSGWSRDRRDAHRCWPPGLQVFSGDLIRGRLRMIRAF